MIKPHDLPNLSDNELKQLLQDCLCDYEKAYLEISEVDIDNPTGCLKFNQALVCAHCVMLVIKELFIRGSLLKVEYIKHRQKIEYVYFILNVKEEISNMEK